MYKKIWFFYIVFYFIYQLIRCYRKKHVPLNGTEMTICLLIVASSLRDWPLYLDDHLCAGSLSFLYGIGMFHESLRKEQVMHYRIYYFLIAGLLLALAVSQFRKYYQIY